MEKSGDEFKIKFVKKKDDTLKTVFYWPEIEDESIIEEDSIVLVLPEPTPGRRGELIFSVAFSNYNIF